MLQMVQVRRPRCDRDAAQRGQVQRRLHPLLFRLRVRMMRGETTATALIAVRNSKSPQRPPCTASIPLVLLAPHDPRRPAPRRGPGTLNLPAEEEPRPRLRLRLGVKPSGADDDRRLGESLGDSEPHRLQLTL